MQNSWVPFPDGTGPTGLLYKRWVNLGIQPAMEYTRLILISSFSYHFQFEYAKECGNEVVLAPEVQCQLEDMVIGIPPFSSTNKDIPPFSIFKGCQ